MTAPGLKATIEADMFDAYSRRDDVALTALRAVLEAVSSEQLRSGLRTLDDEEVAGLVAKEVRRCCETVSIYRSTRQPQLARRELARLAVLVRYMPAQLSNEELREVVAAVVDEVNLYGRRDLSWLRTAVMDRVGARADFDRVSLMIDEVLAEVDHSGTTRRF